MTLVAPNTQKTTSVTDIVNQSLKLRLYSNNITPSASSVYANFTQVNGGGYAEIALSFGTWSISSDGIATYTPQDLNFTGTTDAPGTIYGYYVVVGTTLIYAERFPDEVVPFTPNNGSTIRITPRVQVS